MVVKRRWISGTCARFTSASSEKALEKHEHLTVETDNITSKTAEESPCMVIFLASLSLLNLCPSCDLRSFFPPLVPADANTRLILIYRALCPKNRGDYL